MRNPVYEQFFEKHGIPYEYQEEVRLEEINVAKSLENQARITVKLDPERVERYMLAMADGDRFPAIVCWRDPQTTLLVAFTGNHRIAATKEGGWDVLNCGAYILQVTDPQTRNLITREINKLEGDSGFSKAEAMAHAKHLVRQGENMTKVARRFLISYDSLQGELQADETRARLLSQQRSPGTLPMTTLQRLGSISNDLALAETHKLVEEAKLPGDQVSRLVSDVRGQRTEAGMLAKVAEWREEPAIKVRIENTDQGRNRPSPSVRAHDTLLRAIATVNNLLLKYETPEELHVLTEEDIRQVEERWLTANTRMRKFIARGRIDNGSIASGTPAAAAPTGAVAPAR